MWSIQGDTTSGPVVGGGSFTGGSINRAAAQDYKPLIIGAVVLMAMYILAKKAKAF